MHPAVYLTVASGAEHPLLDFDYSVTIQLVIFVITAVVATRLLFRPYLKMRDERSAGMEGAREDAVRMGSEADARLADYEQKLATARMRAQEERHRIRSEAAAHLTEVTENARKQAAEAMDEARATVSAESTRAREQLLPKTHELAAVIASRLLGREVAP